MTNISPSDFIDSILVPKQSKKAPSDSDPQSKSSTENVNVAGEFGSLIDKMAWSEAADCLNSHKSDSSDTLMFVRALCATSPKHHADLTSQGDAMLTALLNFFELLIPAADKNHTDLKDFDLLEAMLDLLNLLPLTIPRLIAFKFGPPLRRSLKVLKDKKDEKLLHKAKTLLEKWTAMVRKNPLPLPPSAKDLKEQISEEHETIKEQQAVEKHDEIIEAEPQGEQSNPKDIDQSQVVEEKETVQQFSGSALEKMEVEKIVPHPSTQPIQVEPIDKTKEQDKKEPEKEKKNQDHVTHLLKPIIRQPKKNANKNFNMRRVSFPDSDHELVQVRFIERVCNFPTHAFDPSAIPHLDAAREARIAAAAMKASLKRHLSPTIPWHEPPLLKLPEEVLAAFGQDPKTSIQYVLPALHAVPGRILDQSLVVPPRDIPNETASMATADPQPRPMLGPILAIPPFDPSAPNPVTKYIPSNTTVNQVKNLGLDANEVKNLGLDADLSGILANPDLLNKLLSSDRRHSLPSEQHQSHTQSTKVSPFFTQHFNVNNNGGGGDTVPCEDKPVNDVCRFWKPGRNESCWRGETCKFVHPGGHRPWDHPSYFTSQGGPQKSHQFHQFGQQQGQRRCPPQSNIHGSRYEGTDKKRRMG